MLKEILVKSAYATDYSNSIMYAGGDYNNLTLESIFPLVANVIIYVGWGLVLIFLALGFIKFVTSQGDKVGTEQAQKWVTYSIIGGVGLLLVYAIRGILKTFTGVTI